MSNVLNILSQEMLNLHDGRHAVLITQCRATGATTTVTIPPPANTGTGAPPGSKGTTRTTTVGVAVLLDHGELASEAGSQSSGTSTAPTVTIAANSTDTRESDVTVVSASATPMAEGDLFTLVSLHRLEDLSYTEF